MADDDPPRLYLLQRASANLVARWSSWRRCRPCWSWRRPFSAMLSSPAASGRQKYGRTQRLGNLRDIPFEHATYVLGPPAQPTDHGQPFRHVGSTANFRLAAVQRARITCGTRAIGRLDRSGPVESRFRYLALEAFRNRKRPAGEAGRFWGYYRRRELRLGRAGAGFRLLVRTCFRLSPVVSDHPRVRLAHR
jgi:hypothetical protein